MDFKQIICFKTIVEEGTISKAAEKLGVSQPPLSKQLQSLESQLGVKLMERGSRHIKLTNAGKQFYKRCIQIISLTDLTCTEMQTYNKHQTLRIGVTSSTIAIMHRPSTSPFFKDYPDVTFEITEGNTYDIISKLKSNLIDIAFIRTPFDSSDLKYIIIKNDSMMAVGASKYINSNNPISLKEVCDNRIIIHRRYLEFFTDVCMNHQLNPHILCRTDDCRTSLIWAEKGMGIAVVPASACDFFSSCTLKSRPIDTFELDTKIAIVWRKDSSFSSVQQDFINCFK